MGHLYKELNEIPVPDFAKPDGYRVYSWVDIGGGERKKIYIGEYARKEADPPTFYPSENYRLFFPLEWQKHYGSAMLPKYHISIGNYLLCLGIGHSTKLYQSLHSSFGPLYGNLLIDYAMYSIKERSNVAYLFKPAMANSFLFTSERKDDDWISNVFNNEITMDMIHKFKEAWILQCKKLGITEVWLTVDGSNSNYESQESKLSQKGKAKSKKNVEIVSYIWAVSTPFGIPVTFAINEGGCADCKAFDEIRVTLAAYGISVKGIILDRGFLTHDVINNISKSGYDYIVKLKEDTHAQKKMVSDYGDLIYWNMEYISGEGGRFGIVSDDKRYIFQSHTDAAYIGLFFDGINGSERKTALANKVFQEILSVEQQMEHGVKPIVSKTMQRYIEIVKVHPNDSPEKPLDTQSKDGILPENMVPDSEALAFSSDSDEFITTNKEEIREKPQYKWAIYAEHARKDMWVKGFDSLASSLKMSPREMDRVYHSRDISEKQYMISKSMLGNDVFRSHSDQGVQTRTTVAFIATILRCYYMRYCQNESLKLSRFIEEVDDKLFLLLSSNRTYMLVNKLTEKQISVFNSAGIKTEDFNTITGEINLRIRQKGKGVSQFHDMPKDIREKYKLYPNSEELTEPVMLPGEDEPIPKNENEKVLESSRGKAGRPPGRKNNKTLAREASERSAGTIPKPRSKKGRPPGSKNKKTLAREAAQAAQGIQKPEPRGKGRPIGSKDSKPRKRRTKAELDAAIG